MIKVISTCLFGSDSKYTIGAIKNAKLSKLYYPDYEFWIYIHKNTVPQSIIDELKLLDNVKIIYKEGDLSSSLPMTWRFEAIDNPAVDIMLCRDLDTRISEREVIIVNEWLQTNKTFHIIRDHPHHDGLIFGGMFGTKKIKNISSWKVLLNKIIQHGHTMYDVIFLRNHIYPIIQYDCVIHANFNRYEKHCEYLPKYNKNYDFIGEYVYADDTRSQSHKNILINHIKLAPDRDQFVD